MSSDTRFTKATGVAIREAVREASENEVFFVGTLHEGLVAAVTVAARGNDYSVPALTSAARPGDVVIHNHPGSDLTPSDADLSIAARLTEEGIAFYITDNEASKVYAVTEPFVETSYTPLSTSEITELLGPGGSVSRALERYESRDEQLCMALASSEAYNKDKLLVVEAGTGVGKSLAYLVPSILWAKRNRERVVIATKTINLQEQLIEKDLPLLRTALSEPFKAVLVKGRANYVCLRKVREFGREPDFFDEGESAAIVEWAENTRDGSLSDLGFTPKPGTWESFASDADTCLRLKCDHYTGCFFNLSRRETAGADILVVNHHLLFSDAAIKEMKGCFTEAAVLPPYTRVVIDEAHSMEDTATDHFGAQISQAGVTKQLGRLRSLKKAKKGLLPFLVSRISRLGLPMGEISERLSNDLTGLTENCHATTRDLFGTLFHFFHSRHGTNDTLSKITVNKTIKEDEDWSELTDHVREYTLKLRKLSTGLRQVLKKISDEVSGGGEAEKELMGSMVEIRAISLRLSDIAAATEEILFTESPDAVRWVEVVAPPLDNPGRPSRVTLRLSPLSVAERINEALFDNVKTAVMTSATLSVSRSFDFFKERSGLLLADGERHSEMLLDSPFDFAAKVELVLADELAPPTSREYLNELSKVIPDIIEDSGGATLILFTSYALLTDVHNALVKPLKSMGYNLMRQGEAPRHQLLERFRNDCESVLLGTDSFWEGVDVPGDSLKTVIITRLPFEVPGDPVSTARKREIERSGGNPFKEYFMPKAIIKFRQGFGRLIRNKTDQGSVIVLDSRITKKSYGKSFLKSLPECRVKTSNFKKPKLAASTET